MKYSQLWSSTLALCSKRCQFVQNGFLVCDLANIVLLQKYTVESLWDISIERILFWCESLPFFKLLLLWITSYFIFIYSHRLLNQQSAIELLSSFEEAYSWLVHAVVFRDTNITLALLYKKFTFGDEMSSNLVAVKFWFSN